MEYVSGFVLGMTFIAMEVFMAWFGMVCTEGYIADRLGLFMMTIAVGMLPVYTKLLPLSNLDPARFFNFLAFYFLAGFLMWISNSPTFWKAVARRH